MDIDIDIDIATDTDADIDIDVDIDIDIDIDSVIYFKCNLKIVLKIIWASLLFADEQSSVRSY